MENLSIPTTYPALREEIARIFQEGKERARWAVEREKVRTYGEIGRVLNEHLLAHRNRADYGEKVVVRLAEDLQMSRSLVYHILEFYRSFGIVQTFGQLGWTHYLALVKLPTKAERNFYIHEASCAGWSVRELKAQIKANAFAQAQKQISEKTASKQEDGPPLKAKRGRLYTYRTVEPAGGHGETGGLWLDLGFEITHAPAFHGPNRRSCARSGGAGRVPVPVQPGGSRQTLHLPGSR